MIKAITFDLDGVYFNENSFKNFKEKLPKKVTDPEIVNYVLSKSAEILNFKKGLIREEEYWAYVKGKLGVDLGIGEIKELLANCYQTNEEVVDVVKRTRANGYKACICTNNFSTRIEAINNKFRLFENFDIVVLSYLVGAIKPELKIFQKLIEETGVLPNEIAYADDKPENVEAAKSLGINAFLYENFSQFLEKLKELGVDLE
jgi:epoxide hydrolase-like predicted phosphatase